ncbi:hypothetical protein U9M48_018569 [Paspalum notatum var. saurae]|uniref:RING-CH-type domain-containing protein n=1 Tax=Paspalum notatum var. saurae TaxID=547442 RepID=A0AAQ3TBR5_PASNO
MGGEPVKDCSRAPPPPLSRGGPLEDSLLLVHSPPARFSIKKAVDEEIDAASAAVCRICFDHGPGDELISPCMCKGTQQFVHRSCLDHWRSVKEGTAFSHCTTCKAQFHLRVQFLEGDLDRKMKFRLFVARDIFLAFLAIQTAIAAISGMSYLQDKDGKFRNSFTSDWVRILSKHPVPFYYCIGVVVFFALVGLIGFIWHCCTCPPSNNNYDSPRLVVYSNRGSDSEDKDCFAAVVVLIIIFAIVGIEFVVEDLQGGYTPPKMNPEHKQRLKLLQLM